jgi:hypothetical protein
MHWQKLDRDNKIKTIESITSSDTGGLFSVATCDVEQARLSFYNNYRLFKITNYSSLPSFSFEYLSDGTFFHHLDGTEGPIYVVNDKGELSLNEYNVVSYLEFFFSVSEGDDGEEMVVLKDVDSMPLLSSMGEDVSDAMLRSHKNPKVKYSEAEGKYTVETDMFSDGQMIRATIDVSQTGRVKILEQKMITSSFVAKGIDSEWAL